jgi:hypothetical protein
MFWAQSVASLVPQTQVAQSRCVGKGSSPREATGPMTVRTGDEAVKMGSSVVK